MKPARRTAVTFCRMIKIEHSIFALPWAWAGAVLAARGLPPLFPLLMLRGHDRGAILCHGPQPHRGSAL